CSTVSVGCERRESYWKVVRCLLGDGRDDVRRAGMRRLLCRTIVTVAFIPSSMVSADALRDAAVSQCSQEQTAQGHAPRTPLAPPQTLAEQVKRCAPEGRAAPGDVPGPFDAYVLPDGRVTWIGSPPAVIAFKKCMSEQYGVWLKD